MSLDQDKSFYCVVDGTVQLFARTENPVSHSKSGTWDEEDMNGYQLLNEVGTGGTLSSLFTILSLFTENVKISWQDDDDPLETDTDTASEVGSVAPSERSYRPPARPRAQRSNSDVSTMHLDRLTQSPGPISPPSRGRGASVSSSGSTIHQTDIPSPPRLSSFSQAPSISGISSSSAETYRRRPAPDRHTRSYGVVARATEDSTLAVIPAEAFRRLTKKFPKAAAHIVQGMCSMEILLSFTRLVHPSDPDPFLSCHIQRGAQLSWTHYGGPSHRKGHQ